MVWLENSAINILESSWGHFNCAFNSTIKKMEFTPKITIRLNAERVYFVADSINTKLSVRWACTVTSTTISQHNAYCNFEIYRMLPAIVFTISRQMSETMNTHKQINEREKRFRIALSLAWVFKCILHVENYQVWEIEYNKCDRCI